MRPAYWLLVALSFIAPVAIAGTLLLQLDGAVVGLSVLGAVVTAPASSLLALLVRRHLSPRPPWWPAVVVMVLVILSVGATSIEIPADGPAVTLPHPSTTSP